MPYSFTLADKLGLADRLRLSMPHGDTGESVDGKEVRQ